MDKKEGVESRRQQILSAAIKVLSQKGLDKTKVSDIAAEAGVAQGTFYLYYGSKNALIPAMADDMLQKTLGRMKEEIDPCLPFQDQLQAIVGITFDMTASYREVLGLCYSGMAVTGAFLEWERIYKPYYQWLEERLWAARQKGEITSNLRVDMAAKILVEAMEGIAEQAYLFEEVDEAQEYQEELMAFLSRALKP